MRMVVVEPEGVARAMGVQPVFVLQTKQSMCDWRTVKAVKFKDLPEAEQAEILRAVE